VCLPSLGHCSSVSFASTSAQSVAIFRLTATHFSPLVEHDRACRELHACIRWIPGTSEFLAPRGDAHKLRVESTSPTKAMGLTKR
jgi:hypothetical protein